MKTIKTSELAGSSLDWAVAKIDDRKPILITDEPCENYWVCQCSRALGYVEIGERGFSPSTYPEDGQPIMERELIGSMPVSDAWWRAGDVDGANGFGPTMLIAAMRCYVASKLGDTVEVPEELA